MTQSLQLESRSASLPRAALAVVAGLIVWMVGFLILAQTLVLVWPAYAAPARIWVHRSIYTFSLPLSVVNASLWVIAELAAGWLTAVIARQRQAVWCLAALVMAYLCFMHLYQVWHELPRWYNLVVALDSGPLVLLGGMLGARRRR